MNIEPKTFSAICYLILMNHHGQGIFEAHPNYIREKLAMLDAGYDAYSFLDIENQRIVVDLLRRWRYDTPEPVVEYNLRTFQAP